MSFKRIHQNCATTNFDACTVMVGLILLRGINTINFTLSPTMSNESDVKRLRPTIGDTFVFTKQEKRQFFIPDVIK